MNFAAAATVSILLIFFSVNSFAEDTQTTIGHQVETTAETVVENPNLASSLGLGADVHFSAPRNFRVSVFNTEHVDVEPSSETAND